MAQAKKIQVDVSKVRLAIETGTPLTITTYTLPHEMEDYMADVLKVFLTEVHQTQMVESLSYCLKELINNAKKANTKRVYFEELGLDINDPGDYAQGMKTFKEDTVAHIQHYLEKQKADGRYIKVILQTRNNCVRVEVHNRSELTYFEYKRIHDKITRAQQFNSVEEGIEQLLDSTEGAGLGLVIMILVLKRIGLTEENYQVQSDNGETVTRLILPYSNEMQNHISTLSNEFVQMIEGLPEFPENISAINRLISDPRSRMSDIAQRISNDVSLTGELLKLVNSAAFALPVPCRSIGDAVKLAGLGGIRNLLFSVGSMHALMVDDSEEDRKALWDHSYQVAFYAHNLARTFFRSDKSCVEDSYVCGLLHDMGKIVFENAHPSMLAKMDALCTGHGISTDFFERMVAGVNHGEIGAQIAEKWNFPSVIINVIRYHHDPEAAPEENRKLTSVIYLADMLSHYKVGNAEFPQFDSGVLALFNLTSESDLEALSERLSAAFRQSR